VAFQLREKL